MIQSLIIHLSRIFGAPCHRELLHIRPSIPIKADLTTCWKSELGEVYLHEYDGLDGYIYKLELCITKEIAIDMEINKHDIHVLYNLSSPKAIQLCDPTESAPYILNTGRARFFYLPPWQYRLLLPKGDIQFFGFYFQPKILRNNNARPFRFLHPLIEAYRQKLSRSLSSIDFKIGSRTVCYIEGLLQNVKSGDLMTEGHILYTVVALIVLSGEKVFDEYERTSDPEELIRRCRQRIAKQIRDSSQPVILKNIAAQLHCTVDHLSKLHLKYHECSLSVYRNELLLQKIKALLSQSWTLLEISERCGFQGSSEIGRFFKRQTGITPNEYRKTLL